MEKNDEMFEDSAQAIEERLKELEKQKMTLPNEEEVSLKEVMLLQIKLQKSQDQGIEIRMRKMKIMLLI